MCQVIATIKSIMGLVIAVVKFIMGRVVAVIKFIIMSPGLCDTSITWVPIGRSPSPPATVDERDEDDQVLYLPQECALCLEAMRWDDKTIASMQNNPYPPFPAMDQGT